MQKLLVLSPHVRVAFLRPTVLPESATLKIVPGGNLVSKSFKIVYFTQLLSHINANKTEGKEYTSKRMTVKTTYYWVIHSLNRFKQVL